MSTHSVDDLLVRVENNKLGVEQPPLPAEAPKESIKAEAPQIDVLHGTNPPIDQQAPQTEQQQQQPQVDHKEPLKEAPLPEKLPEAASGDSPIDEYGNPIEKPKTYTEDEVQRMIRERLARGRHPEQQATLPPQHQQQQQQVTGEEGSDEPWDVQLKRFVKQTMEETHQEQKQRQWQEQESQRQVEFESKFSLGMGKYTDFHEVVAGKPITDTMMLAARNLDNPAAFIYGASKMHPQEIERIARIPDPYAQAAEVGKLHEKMVKAGRVLSGAPKPIDTPKTSLPNKVNQQPSLESRIDAYAKQKRR